MRRIYTWIVFIVSALLYFALSLNILSSSFTDIVLEVSKFILSTVIAGYFFAVVISAKPNIIFSKKLVIRQSEADCPGENLLGILVGNRYIFGKKIKPIFNLRCGLTCVCQKWENVNFTKDIEDRCLHVLRNYYRFSFDVNDIPMEFWEKYINYIKQKSAESSSDIKKPDDRSSYITVLLSGSTNFFGNSFVETHTYYFDDIKIVKEKRDETTYRITEKKIDWKKFKKYSNDDIFEDDNDVELRLRALLKRSSK